MPRYVDRAQDPFATLFEEAAVAYDAYQRDTYDRNYDARRESWEKHYAYMREKFENFLLKVSDERGKRRGEMGVAIVGPGNDPAVRDFDHRLLRNHLSHLHSIVLVDFSTAVLRSAMRSLIHGGVPEERIYGMQYDITNGLSTLYQRWIRRVVINADVRTEENFDKVAEDLENLQIETLDGMLVDELERAEEEERREQEKHGDLLLPGQDDPDDAPRGRNSERKFSPIVARQALLLDVVALQMVLAGTGAAAEAEMWTRYEDLCSEPERGARQPGPEADLARRLAYQRIHTMIARFNTEIAERIIRRILEDNPEAQVLAFADVGTAYEKPVHTWLPRLRIVELQERFGKQGIVMDVHGDEWQWDDEPDHSHNVVAFEARVGKRNGGKLVGSVVNGGQQRREGGIPPPPQVGDQGTLAWSGG